MTRPGFAVVTAALLAAASGLAAQRERIGVDWTGFQQQVSVRKLSQRTVRTGVPAFRKSRSVLFVSAAESGVAASSVDWPVWAQESRFRLESGRRAPTKTCRPRLPRSSPARSREWPAIGSATRWTRPLRSS